MGREEEKEGLMRIDGDADSIRSFASSSTLAPPDDDDANIDEKRYTSVFTQQQPQHPSWLRTPLTPRGLTTLLFRLLTPLLPSFLHPKTVQQPRRLSSTSYLDGLRGVAALIVFNSHFLTNWHYPLRSGYLSSPGDVYILQLPIVRLFYAGRASVAVFFVISGFVLSYKPLLLLRQKGGGGRGGGRSEVLKVLSSSVFRRGMRLWIPILFGTFISALLAGKGWYTPVPSRGDLIPPTFPSLREQVVHWMGELSEFAFPWKGSGVDGNAASGFVYNGHLWTIPIEVYGSFVVFLTVLGVSGVRRGARGVVVLGLMWWAVRGARWDMGCFLGGVVCAEWSISMAPEEKGLPMHGDARFPFEEDEMAFEKRGESELARLSRKAVAALPILLRPCIKSIRLIKGPLSIALLFVALFLLSYAGESPSPGLYHDFLIPWTPGIWESIPLGREHFWLCIGALLLLFSLTNSTALQRPFNTRFAQYLGDISYSLYIVHGMVLFTLGTGLMERWTGLVGVEQWVDNGSGELVEVVVTQECEVRTWWMAFWACWVVNVVVVFWAADLFWRVVDGRVPGWGRWVEGLVSESRRW